MILNASIEGQVAEQVETFTYLACINKEDPQRENVMRTWTGHATNGQTKVEKVSKSSMKMENQLKWFLRVRVGRQGKKNETKVSETFGYH